MVSRSGLTRTDVQPRHRYRPYIDIDIGIDIDIALSPGKAVFLSPSGVSGASGASGGISFVGQSRMSHSLSDRIAHCAAEAKQSKSKANYIASHRIAVIWVMDRRKAMNVLCHLPQLR